MFTIVISEKGGAERREPCDKNEINVGRVQGNDLMLPKGNVSKHHARLLFRDGRFIVTDLKSTNGTYVNGRKISQATIVREGDKIYIGDFVLRLETGLKVAQEASYVENESLAVGDLSPASRRAPLPAPTPAALPASEAGPSSPMLAPPFPASPRPSEPGHFPLERDPDSESAPSLKGPATPQVAVPPRVPQPGEPRPRTNSTVVLGGEHGPAPGEAASPGAPPARRPRSVPPPPPVLRPAPRETPHQAARRLALITLVDRVGDVVDLAPLEQSPVVAEPVSQAIERAVREQAKAMRQEGEIPEGIDLELLARDALRELVGLGPVGPLLDDDEATEMHVIRHDSVLVLRSGQTMLAEPSFTSEEALARIISRLAQQSGDPLRSGELIIDRRLPRGAYLTALAPPAVSGWVLHVRKRRRIEASLAQLVSAGTISEAMAAFLEHSASVRANVLVVGSGAGAVSFMLGAIASAAPPAERVAVLNKGADELALPHAHLVPMALADHGPHGEESVYAAARFGVDRLIVTSLVGAVATAVVDVIAEGSEAVLAGVGAPSLRHALARLVSQVALSRPGSTIEAAREAVGESFDVAVEVDRAADGRLRVVRVAEIEGSDGRGVVTRDLFVLSENGSSGSSYRATGVSPRLARDFASRALKVEGIKR